MKIGDLVQCPFASTKNVGIIIDTKDSFSTVTLKFSPYCHVLWCEGQSDWEPREVIEAVK